ncbi:pyridoxamine 5'-phosphate oxidase family protein [Selenomonas noxia]
MGSQECLELLRGIRDCAFATIDRNGLPAVRMIDVMLVEEGRLFFCTARGKDFYAELLANSAVAVTGLNDKSPHGACRAACGCGAAHDD